MTVMRTLWAAALFAGIALLALRAAIPAEETAAAPGGKPLAAVLEVDGPIGPATSDYFERGLEKAREMGASVVVLRMDTPGGLDTSMRDIIQEILSAPLPVISYVAPGGARAASAGTYILYASHVAAMAPATNLGAATPVRIGGPGMPGEQPKDGKEPKKGTDKAEDDSDSTDKASPKPAKPGLDEKALNDARAYIRSLAQLRGRNVEWAEKAVTEAASLPAAEALEKGVIDLMAGTLDQLLAKAHGRKVTLGAGEVTVRSKDAAVRVIAPDWRTEFLAVITNPNVAYILLMIGIYGIIFEFYNPGIIFSGVIGAICLLLALFALHVLPVNFAGVALIVLGIAFMAAEAFVPSFGALGLGGVAALVIGSVILMDTDAPGFGISWYVIAAVATVSAALSFLILTMAASAWRRPVVSGREGMVGAGGRVIEWDGGAGRVRVMGEVWRARSDEPLSRGEAVRVAAVEGLVLHVRAAEASDERS